MAAKRVGVGYGKLENVSKGQIQATAAVGVIFQALIPASPTAGGELESLQGGSYHSGDFWRTGMVLRLSLRLMLRFLVCLEFTKSRSVIVTSKNKQLPFLPCIFYPGHEDSSKCGSRTICKRTPSPYLRSAESEYLEYLGYSSGIYVLF